MQVRPQNSLDVSPITIQIENLVDHVSGSKASQHDSRLACSLDMISPAPMVFIENPRRTALYFSNPDSVLVRTENEAAHPAPIPPAGAAMIGSVTCGHSPRGSLGEGTTSLGYS